MKVSEVVCSHEGCTRSVVNGDAIHRISPKGGPFAGLCTEHYREVGEAFDRLDDGTSDTASEDR